MSKDAQFWDKTAERYARSPVGDPDAYERKLEVTRAHLHPTDVVLEVGCGTGSLALELAPRVAQVHAVDISGEMLKIGKRKAADQQVTNIRFHHGTLEDVESFEPEGFDGVCAYSILHLVHDRAATLRRIFTLLKPGGFFVSSTVCLGDSLIPFRPILAVMRWAKKAPSVQVIRADALLDEMRETGFVDVSTPEVGAKRIIAFVVARKPH